jgi:formiminoglutamate deiminase
VTDLDQYARLVDASRQVLAPLPDARLGVAPHSLRAASPAELQRVVGLLPGAPVHIHAAEQIKEVEECVAWSGARPVQWLLDHADVDSRWCLVHATHMLEDESARLARSGAVAGFCPVTEANLGDGIAPAAAFMRAGGTVGIGTDSNVRISVSEELRQLEYSQRLRDRARNVLAEQSAHSTGRTLFATAHRGGERALGAGPVPIGLTPGRQPTAWRWTWMKSPGRMMAGWIASYSPTWDCVMPGVAAGAWWEMAGISRAPPCGPGTAPPSGGCSPDPVFGLGPYKKRPPVQAASVWIGPRP